MTPDKIYIAEDSPFLTTDTRQNRWAIPYSFECQNARIDTLLGNHKDVIVGKTILDVGSHMGTFAYAAHQMGARWVHGIDVENKMVEKCRQLFQSQNIPEASYRFEVENVLRFLESTPENSFDTVFCFGVLYYTEEPFRLLELMSRAAKETVLLDTFTAGYAAVQGKDADAVFPAIKDETLNLPLMIVSLTRPEKKDYRLPESFDYRGKDLSMITLPTRALFEIWFERLKLKYSRLDWSGYATRSCSFHDLITPQQKKDSHWSDVYSSGLRVSYRLSPTTPATREEK
jgi:ubiquinone/menaquinone biosynthesis C-methylase UbiE